MILGDFSRVRVFVRPGVTDMRKQINGLSLIAQTEMREDPLGGDLFAFCGRRRDLVKLLWWDRNGFCLWQKRLERDKFRWPETAEDVRDFRPEHLELLLDGVDFRRRHRAREYSRVI